MTHTTSRNSPSSIWVGHDAAEISLQFSVFSHP
jgi:hypothetical protein